MKEKLNFNSQYYERETAMHRILSNTSSSQFGECMIWNGAKDKSGYGICFFNGKSKRAHRVIMLLSGKDISGKSVGHRCGNSSCCQPSHMFFCESAEKYEIARKKFTPLYSRGRSKISKSQLYSARGKRCER